MSCLQPCIHHSEGMNELPAALHTPSWGDLPEQAACSHVTAWEQTIGCNWWNDLAWLLRHQVFRQLSTILDAPVYPCCLSVRHPQTVPVSKCLYILAMARPFYCNESCFTRWHQYWLGSSLEPKNEPQISSCVVWYSKPSNARCCTGAFFEYCWVILHT